ncbi:patatin-like phospholipase family protein [Sorangium sp. So ce134]
MDTPKRLSITISGAVSLGAYEAGVLYEVIKAIGEHNENPDTRRNPAERIEIDVLTGASAGGMTASVAAQVMLAGADRMRSATDNPFYLPWVKEADILDFLSGTPETDPPRLSILSSSIIDRIAVRHLVDAPAGARHPATPEAGVRLGLAMANVNGVDYSVPTRNPNGQGEFTYTRFQDEFVWHLRQPGSAEWTAVREAAIACGSFPIAFRPRRIWRTKEDYPGAAPQNFPAGARLFTFVDGGMFQNEPLGLAKALVNEIDAHENVGSRFYLYISPEPKTGVAMLQDIQADKPTIGRMLVALPILWIMQALSQDWVRIQQVNGRIWLLKRRAGALAEMLLANPSFAAMLRDPLMLLLAHFYPGAPSGDIAALRAASPWREDLRRLGGLFATLPGPDGTPVDYAARLGAEAAEVWLMAILLLERAAGLEGKDEMTIYTITAEVAQLAGGRLFSFAGFIDESLRQHDYALGRQRARDWLTTGKDGLFPIRGTFAESIPPIDRMMPRWRMAQFDLSKRLLLRDHLRARLLLIAGASPNEGIRTLGRWLVLGLFNSGEMDTLLEIHPRRSAPPREPDR